MMVDYESYKGFSEPDADRSILLSAYNKPLTAQLFVERTKVWKSTNTDRDVEPVYTLGEVELEDKPSAYKIYMASADEYEAAMRLVGSLYHWTELCKTTWFMEELVQWREHMALRDYSLAKRAILKDVRGNDGAAARKLADMATRVINPPKAKTKPKQDTQTPEGSDLDQLYNTYLKNTKDKV